MSSLRKYFGGALSPFSGLPKGDADRRPHGTFCPFFFPKEHQRLEKENEALKHQARRDGLTGLLNATTFEEKTIEMIRDFILDNREPRGSIVLIFLDLDGFKQANDSYGHDVGDTILRRFSEILKTEMRDNDIVARKGGDEFTIAVHVTSKDAEDGYIHRMHELRDDLSERLGKYAEIGPEAAKGISFSFGAFIINDNFIDTFGVGLSVLTRASSIAAEAYVTGMKRADFAMYGDKEKKEARRLAGIERRQAARIIAEPSP